MLKTDEISGTIRRVGTSNSDCFASAAPATAYPPLATRSAAFPLPSPHSAPLSRLKANERPSTPTLPNHRPPELLIPSKIPRAAYPASKIAREASFPSEAHDETARRSEELLWADIHSFRVNLSVGTEFGKRSQSRLFISIFNSFLTLP